MMHKAWRSIEEVPYCFLRSSIKFHSHTGGKIDDLNPIWDYKAGRSYQIPQICLVTSDFHILVKCYQSTDTSVVNFFPWHCIQWKRQLSVRSVLTHILTIETVTKLVDCCCGYFTSTSPNIFISLSTMIYQNLWHDWRYCARNNDLYPLPNISAMFVDLPDS